jgi:beta-fructofuranosidase
MSLPRRHFLANVTRTGLHMYSAPYGLDAIRGDQLASNASLTNSTLFANYQDVESNAVYFEVNVTGINTTTISGAATLNFTFFSPITGEYLRGGYYFGGKLNYVNSKNRY